MMSHQENYEKAYKRVEHIKCFYSHVQIFVVSNIIFVAIAYNLVGELLNNIGFRDINFERWANYNIIATPIIWGVVLILHGLYVYRHRFSFLKNWEKRMIDKYMAKNEEETHSKWE